MSLGSGWKRLRCQQQGGWVPPGGGRFSRATRAMSSGPSRRVERPGLIEVVLGEASLAWPRPSSLWLQLWPLLQQMLVLCPLPISALAPVSLLLFLLPLSSLSLTPLILFPAFACLFPPLIQLSSSFPPVLHPPVSQLTHGFAAG